MKRLLGIALAAALTVALPARGSWPEIASTWHEIQNSDAVIPSTCLVAGQVPFLLSPTSLGLGCDAGLTYDAATDALTSTGGATLAAVRIGKVGGNGYVLVDSTTGTDFQFFSRDGMTIASSLQLKWSATDTIGVPDSGLRRVSPGLVGVTSGSSNLGSLQAGNITAVGLASVAPVVVTNVGSAGATTNVYVVLAFLNDGSNNFREPAAAATSNAVLDGTNFNRLSWNAVPGAAYYAVYRASSGGTPASNGKIWTGTAVTMDDTGLVGDGTSYPTTNTTGRILVGDGTPATPSVASTTYPNTGLFWDANPGLNVTVSGNARMLVYGVATEFYTGSLLLYNTSHTFAAPMRVDAANVLQLGAAPNATPVANTLVVGESGVGTDIAGAPGVIQSGAGTGAGAVSTLTFKTPAAHGSDAVAQTQGKRLLLGEGYAEFSSMVYPNADDTYSLGVNVSSWKNLYLSRATLGSKSKALTDATPTAFASVGISDGTQLSGEIIYSVKAIKGTALQVLSGRARFAATREGSTYTVSISEVGTQTSAMAAGTLTGSISIAGAASAITFSANFDTSQSSPDTLAIFYRFDSTDAALAITPL